MSDAWAGDPPTSSGAFWRAVTPNDAADNCAVTRNGRTFLPRMIHVAGGGTVVCVGDDGEAASFTFLDGQDRPIRPVRIRAAGTTATGIVAVY